MRKWPTENKTKQGEVGKKRSGTEREIFVFRYSAVFRYTIFVFQMSEKHQLKTKRHYLMNSKHFRATFFVVTTSNPGEITTLLLWGLRYYIRCMHANWTKAKYAQKTNKMPLRAGRINGNRWLAMPFTTYLMDLARHYSNSSHRYGPPPCWPAMAHYYCHCCLGGCCCCCYCDWDGDDAVDDHYYWCYCDGLRPMDRAM